MTTNEAFDWNTALNHLRAGKCVTRLEWLAEEQEKEEGVETYLTWSPEPILLFRHTARPPNDLRYPYIYTLTSIDKRSTDWILYS